jgi:hypothetical protein
MILTDFEGCLIRLTPERFQHILEHPEMKPMGQFIGETMADPMIVMQSRSDLSTHLYYRNYSKTLVGDKYLCVVVKKICKDPFVLTAYLTDSIKKGALIWPKKQ